MDCELIVIGGGAAGMFAAARAGSLGVKTLLCEPNDRLGKKLNITGKGRCNLTNNCTPAEVLQNVPRNSRFLYSAMAGCSPQDVMRFFERHDCPVKTERGNRVFPVSDRAESVIAALKAALREAGVQIAQARAQELLTQNGAICGVKTDKGGFTAPCVMLATGGCSYPRTGSTGEGYALAGRLGHTVIPPKGSLVPMVEDGGWCAKMQGLSLKNVSAKLLDARGRTVYEELGELLFTHFGLSGPVILSMSAHMAQKGPYTVSIDLKPALDEQKLDARLLRDFAEQQNRAFSHALSGLFPRSLIPVIVERSGIPGDLRINAVTKQQRRTLLELTKGFTVKIAGLRPVEEAIITSGGIATGEIDPKTMESKKIPGLYFAGEIIDCDAYTGGFNLQIAWATAYAAASAAARRLGKGGTNE